MSLRLKFSRDAELPSLNLVGDGDDLDLIEDIEKSFQIKLQDEEVEQWRTVGDIYRCLLAKIEASKEHQTKCAGQMAFYVVREILNELVPAAKITPETNFADLKLKNHEKIPELLVQKYDLWTPAISPSGWGCLGILLVWLIGGMWLYANEFSLWYLTILIILGIAASLFVMPKKFDGTVGAFAMKLAGLNYAHFVKKGARLDRLRLWDALGHIFEDPPGVKRYAVNRYTLLLSPQDYDKEWIQDFRKARESKYADLISLLCEAEEILFAFQKYHASFQAALGDIKRWIKLYEREELMSLKEVEAAFSPTGTWDDLSSMMTERYSKEAAYLADIILDEINKISQKPEELD